MEKETLKIISKTLIIIVGIFVVGAVVLDTTSPNIVEITFSGALSENFQFEEITIPAGEISFSIKAPQKFIEEMREDSIC